MRKPPALLAFMLCTVVVATVAGVAVAAPADSEHAGEAKLDKLHAVRPIAASPLYASSSFDVDLAAPDPPVAAEVVPEPEPAVPEPPVRRIAVAAPAPAAEAPTDVPAVLACIRWRESRGDYTVVSANGLYHGAYQFLPSTWDSTARASARLDLVGVPPEQASPADQDAMALALYEMQGTRPWGGICA